MYAKVRLRGLGQGDFDVSALYEHVANLAPSGGSIFDIPAPDVNPSLSQMLAVSPPVSTKYVLPGYSPMTSYASAGTFPWYWQAYNFLQTNSGVVWLAAGGAVLWMLMKKRRR